MSEIINGYCLTTEFSNKNAGMCQWAFAQKNGREYFIKQLLQPKFPTKAAESMLSPAVVNTMRSESNKFYESRKRFYDKLFRCQTGNVIVVEDFFRQDAFYYIVTEKVSGPFLTVEEISRLSDDAKRVLLKSVLYSIMYIHNQGIVHSDLKPENIMVKHTSRGFCTAKLLDFESSFFYTELPEEIVGDQRYFSPETLLRNSGRKTPVDTKSDIFSLGLLFHQYWCGAFPSFNRKEYDSAAVALLNDEGLTLNSGLPLDIARLVGRMLSKDPAYRPAAKEAREILSGERPVTVSGGSSGSSSGGLIWSPGWGKK